MLAGNQHKPTGFRCSKKSIASHKFRIVKLSKKKRKFTLSINPPIIFPPSSTAFTAPGLSVPWPRWVEARPPTHPATGLQRRCHALRAALVPWGLWRPWERGKVVWRCMKRLFSSSGWVKWCKMQLKCHKPAMWGMVVTCCYHLSKWWLGGWFMVVLPPVVDLMGHRITDKSFRRQR